jgi:hypothetical protein
MALFDFLSGSDEAEQAAAANRAALAGYGVDVNRLYEQYLGRAGPAITTSAEEAMRAVREGRGGAIGAYEQAYGRGVPYLTEAEARGAGALTGGQAAATGALTGREAAAVEALRSGQGPAAEALGAGISAYAPVTGTAGTAARTLENLGQGYQGDIDAYRDAMGLNGPEGVARAQARFTTGPGYQFQVDEATNQALRAASRGGMTFSGNTAEELRRRAQGFASGEYGDYLTRLGGYATPLVGLQYQARTGAATLPYEAAKFVAPGVAQGYGSLANLFRGTGQDISGVMTGTGGRLADVYGTTAGRLSDLYGTTGRTLADLAGTTGGRIGQAYTGAGTELAGTYTGTGQNLANIYGNIAQGQTGAARDVTTGNIQANNLVAQAGMQNAANWWNLLGSGISGAAKAFAPASAGSYRLTAA